MEGVSIAHAPRQPSPRRYEEYSARSRMPRFAFFWWNESRRRITGIAGLWPPGWLFCAGVR